MSKNIRIALLAFLGLVVVAIMVYPYFNKEREGDFAVTENPGQVLAEAKGNGKPVVLEFYANW